MRNRRVVWGFAVAAAVLTASGCMRIRPEATEVQRDTRVRQAPPPSPARQEVTPGSAEGYPDEAPAPAQPSTPTKSGDEPEVVWGPLPAPIYPNARRVDQSQRIQSGEKPVAYRNYRYTTSASVDRVLAYYTKALGEDEVEVKRVGRQVSIFKNLEKGNLMVTLFRTGGRTRIDIQESQQLQPKKRGLFGRG